MSHMDKAFAAQFGETIERLRKVGRMPGRDTSCHTCHPVTPAPPFHPPTQVTLTESGQPFIIAGSGTLGWDLVAANLVEAGDPVLLLNTGYFGDRQVPGPTL